jgi:carboxymethylenebutenolidase
MTSAGSSPALPDAPAVQLSGNARLQPPLSRRGHGPGLILLLPSTVPLTTTASHKTLDPEPCQKWAEEGYAVVEVRVSDSPAAAEWDIQSAISNGIQALKDLESCDEKEKFGLIGSYSNSNMLNLSDIRP